MKDQHILITGGSGAVGSALAELLLTEYPEVDRITVLSNSEQEQHDMMQRLPPERTRLHYVIADVRDRGRLERVFEGVDTVVHTAAMKHVPLAEMNPWECVQTNVIGTQNVIAAAQLNRVKKVVAVSSDKAVSPINVYGASKLLVERLLVAADAQGSTRFCVVRYANVFGSRGSVVPLFRRLRATGELPITDPEMTRFSISMRQGLDLILFAIQHGWGGEIVVPEMPSYRILDLAEAIAPGAQVRIVGKRQGERLYEPMVCSSEAGRVVSRAGWLVICPACGRWTVDDYLRSTGAVLVAPDFSYASHTNTDWLDVSQLRLQAAQVSEM